MTEATHHPNLFVVGAAKAATTSMHRFLAAHPDVFMTTWKEPHYFSRITPSAALGPFVPCVSDRSAYLDLFRGASRERWRGEASTSYLWSESAPTRITQACDEAHAVILLRDPVERAVSHYHSDVRRGVETRELATALAEDRDAHPSGWGISHLYFELGCYAEQVRRYLESFTTQRVFIAYFEELIADPARVLGELGAFLGVPMHGMRGHWRHENPGAAPRTRLAERVLASARVRRLARTLVPIRARQFVHDRVLLRRVAARTVPRDVDEQLLEAYRPDVERLAALLGRSPPWPRFFRG